MTQKFTFIFSILSIFTFIHVSAQSRIDKAIEILEDKYTQEKVYLLLDKRNYVSGENIGFKAYVFEGYNRSTISTTLFVELYDKEKKLLDQKKVLLKDGEGDGSLTTKEDLKEDAYFIRAYTPWMENFSQEFNYIKPLPIYNPASSQRLIKESNSTWSISASPEGGNLINNVATNLAVRLFSENFAEKNWDGYLIDTANPKEKIINFTSLDENVALFKFTPKAGHNYQVIVQDKNGISKTVDLPYVLETGTTIAVSPTGDGILYSVKTTSTPNGLKGYKVVGTIGNRLAYRANINSDSNEISRKIPSKINDENNGVLQLAVFDDKDNLVAQRLYFVKPKGNYIAKPELKDLNISFDPRSSNSFIIESNENSKHYTVLIQDTSAIAETSLKSDNILTALWLTEDFKNTIHDPNQYFTSATNSEALDAMMISEKWDRFDWNKVLLGNIPLMKYQTQNNITYKGRLALNSRPLPNTPVNLAFKTDEGFSSLSQYTTDHDGFIYLENIGKDKPVTIFYYLNPEIEQQKKPVLRNLTLTITPIAEPTSFKRLLPKSNYILTLEKVQQPSAVVNAIENKKNKDIVVKDEILIKEVNIKVNKYELTQKLNMKLSSSQFRSVDEKVFDFINEDQNIGNYPNVLPWLQGKAGAQIVGLNSPNPTIKLLRNSVKLFLNENRTTIQELQSIPVEDIAMIKMVPRINYSDLMVYTTNERNTKEAIAMKKEQINNKVVLNPINYINQTEQSEYNPDLFKKVVNDTRELLYFNPVVSKNVNAPTQIKFYNNDHAKAYDVTIIGFDKNNNLLYLNEVIK